MNKGAIIGIIIVLAIIGVIASSLSSTENAPDVIDTGEIIENTPDVIDTGEEIIEEPETTGRSLSIELKESVGMKATP
jgi:hypothetical protein